MRYSLSLSPTLSRLGLLRTTSLGYLTNSNICNTSGCHPPPPTCSPSSLTAGGVFRCAGGIIPNGLLSLCYPVVWLVVDYAPTCPRRATFWGMDTGGKHNGDNNQMNFQIKHVRTRVKTCWAYPAGLIRRVLVVCECHGIGDKEIYLWTQYGGQGTPHPPVHVHAIQPYFLYF